MNINKYQRSSGFTLLELLIVVGVLAIVGTIVVMILNPSDLFKQGRDAKRMTDLKAIDTAIRAYKEYGDILKTSSIVQSDPANAVIGLVRENCSGYSNCFTSLAAWQVAKGGINFGACAQGNLVCANKVAVARIEGAWSAPDTNELVINGWTTGPNNYIKIFASSSARHSGKWDDTKYRLELNKEYGGIITILENYATIDGLQVSNIGLRNNYSTGIEISNIVGTTSITISNSIIRATAIDVAQEYSAGILGNTIRASNNTKIYNNIIYGFGAGMLLDGYNANNAFVYNNTIINNVVVGIEINGNAQELRLKNNLVQNATTNYLLIHNDGITEYLSNISSDATSPNTTFRNKTVSFFDVINKDFHLSPSDTAAVGAGTNLSSDTGLAFSNDIDGFWRFNIWDIGADQLQDIYVSLPDINSTCSNYSLPVPPSGWSYRCSSTSTLTKTNGTGWIPVDFTKIPGNTLSSLPIDPNNLSVSGQYYTFVTDGKKWELTSILESDKNKGVDKIGGKDGGQYANILEIGSNLTLTPSAVKNR